MCGAVCCEQDAAGGRRKKRTVSFNEDRNTTIVVERAPQQHGSNPKPKKKLTEKKKKKPAAPAHTTRSAAWQEAVDSVQAVCCTDEATARAFLKHYECVEAAVAGFMDSGGRLPPDVEADAGAVEWTPTNLTGALGSSARTVGTVAQQATKVCEPANASHAQANLSRPAIPNDAKSGASQAGTSVPDADVLANGGAEHVGVPTPAPARHRTSKGDDASAAKEALSVFSAVSLRTQFVLVLVCVAASMAYREWAELKGSRAPQQGENSSPPWNGDRELQQQRHQQQRDQLKLAVQRQQGLAASEASGDPKTRVPVTAAPAPTPRAKARNPARRKSKPQAGTGRQGDKKKKSQAKKQHDGKAAAKKIKKQAAAAAVAAKAKTKARAVKKKLGGAPPKATSAAGRARSSTAKKKKKKKKKRRRGAKRKRKKMREAPQTGSIDDDADDAAADDDNDADADADTDAADADDADADADADTDAADADAGTDEGEFVTFGVPARVPNKHLLPSDVEPMAVYGDWTNTTERDTHGNPQVVAEGSITWPHPLNRETKFAVLPGLMKQDEVEEAMEVLEADGIAGIGFDENVDSVDAMPAHEYFVHNGKHDIVHKGLHDILKPVQDRMTAYVRKRWSVQRCARQRSMRVPVPGLWMRVPVPGLWISRACNMLFSCCHPSLAYCKAQSVQPCWWEEVHTLLLPRPPLPPPPAAVARHAPGWTGLGHRRRFPQRVRP